MSKVVAICLAMLIFMAPQVEAAEGDKPVSDYVGYVELKPFVTNFGADGKLHFLKADVTVQVDSTAGHHAINAHLPDIRNDLIFLFAAQKVKDVSSVAGQQVLAGKALKIVQDIMTKEEGKPYATDLFFTSFIIQ